MSQKLYSTSESEARLLEGLRVKYENQGYHFTAHPPQGVVPGFLGSYQPDAIATRHDKKLIIEVRSRRHPQQDKKLEEIRRRFNDQTEWQFVVSYGGDDPQVTTTIPKPSAELIAQSMKEFRSLIGAEHKQVAFIYGWSLLEATLHFVQEQENKRPYTPATVIETLATLGYLLPETETELRKLISLRNRIVHGDLHAVPTDAEIQVVLDGLKQAQSSE